MNNAEFQLRGVGDPRLAVHATSALPAWLWSVDGTRILWANPVGARLFGAANGAALAQKTFGPADAHRRQVAQLAGRLPLNGAIRLERLRGFGAALGMLVTCGCARLEFADGSHGILIAAAEPVGRAMPLVERLQRLVEGIEHADRRLRARRHVGRRQRRRASAARLSQSLRGRPRRRARRRAEAGPRRDGCRHRPHGAAARRHRRRCRPGRADRAGATRPRSRMPRRHAAGSSGAQSRSHRRRSSRCPTTNSRRFQAKRRPSSRWSTNSPNEPPAETTEPAHAEPAPEPVAPAAEQPMPDYEQPAISGEAPAEFALVDEFADEPPAETMEHHTPNPRPSRSRRPRSSRCPTTSSRPIPARPRPSSP